MWPAGRPVGRSPWQQHGSSPWLAATHHSEARALDVVNAIGNSQKGIANSQWGMANEEYINANMIY